MKSERHIPFFEFNTFEEFKHNIPANCKLIGIELTDNAMNLKDFSHPERAIYLLGAEDHGLPDKIQLECDKIIKLEGDRSLNVGVAGSIVLYHRQSL
jgi:tRNA G18 (ribose-2'-O)-methylase SpoU